MNQSEPTGRRARLLSNAGLLVAGVALSLASTAQAQTPANEAAQSGEEVVMVTGSRLATRGYNAPTPVAVIGAEEVQLSGTVNIENLLSTSPQFIPSINGGSTSNTVPGGNANVNLRGFGAQRNLVLVNGRRFAIQGPDQTVDLNTIPTALIARTEIVTGGSSAVYGSDAITGVVNFIMRDDFEGVEASYQRSWDSPTDTPTDDVNITIGGNFANGRGNAVVSLNYLNRGSITRGERGDWAFHSLSDGCVTAASWSATEPGTPMTVPGGQTCRTAGGIPGLIAGGSGDIPNGRTSGIPIPGSGSSNMALDAAYAAAGLSGMSSFGFTFDDAGAIARPALDPQDRFNLGPDNYLQIPQERWMLNAFTDYDFSPHVTGYMEFHFSSNTVDQQLAPTNVGGSFLLDVNNPYLNANMQEVLNQLDLRETGLQTIVTGSSSRTTTPGDGLAVLTLGRRLVENGFRFNSAERIAWRTAMGFRGDIGDLSPSFLRDLSYDVYYMYARTDETDLQEGSASRSRFQSAILRSGGADPVCNTFGANMTAACISAIGINSTNVTKSETQGAVAILNGVAFDMPAGPVDFSTGFEWRESSAKYSPDSFLSSGDVVGFNPGLPTDGSQSVREIFGEFRVPILAGLPLFERLAFNGAFRYSDYDLDGVGGVWTYSEGIDWTVTSDLTLRGQFQHAIRAPNVGELYGGNATNFNNTVDPCGVSQPGAQQTQAVRDLCIATGVPSANVFTAAVQSPGGLIGNISGGEPNVGAEESDTITFGAVVRPGFMPGLAMSIDYFSIELEGAIAQLGGGLSNTLNLCYNIIQDAGSEFCQAVARNPATGEISPPYFVTITNANTGGIETSGIDFSANYEMDLNWGMFGESSSLSFSTSWTHTDEFTSTPVQAFPEVTNQCVGAFGQTCGEPIPEWKGVSRVSWANGPLNLSLRHRYVGEVTDDRYVLPVSRGETRDLANFTNAVIDPMHYFDLSGTLDVGERLQFFGGVNNIADEDPPVIGSAQVRSNTWPATYDINGRFFFLGAKVRWE